MVIIVMGICGCGKTVVGKLLAQNLSLPFFDADDFHPTSNIEKMKAQIPLNDDDRLPWLKKMADQIPQWQKNGGAVLACSALKNSYRKILRAASDVRFVHLKGPKELILQRSLDRRDHFMPPALIDSQLAALEEPADAVVADITPTPDQIVKYILTQLKPKDADS